MRKFFNSAFAAPVIFLVVWLGLFLYTYITLGGEGLNSKEAQTLFFSEKYTDCMYFALLAGLAFYLKDFIKDGKIGYWIMYFSLSVFAMFREMGLHKSLASVDTTPFKSRFFLNPKNPLDEKIIAGTILLFIAFILVLLVVKYSKHLGTSFFKFNQVTWTLATFFAVLVVSKTIDRFPANYRDTTGSPLSLESATLSVMVEETMEFYIPALALLAVVQYFRNKKQA